MVANLLYFFVSAKSEPQNLREIYSNDYVSQVSGKKDIRRELNNNSRLMIIFTELTR